MGAYLTAPSTKKTSEDFTDSEKYVCGVSGMQGWRISMEDALNCDPEMDEDTGFFAVYDGHGGGEVAMYCSHHFTSILKETKEYKEKNFEAALISTFMAIDRKLKEPRVVKELKLLSQMVPGDPPVTEEDIDKMEKEEREEKETVEEETKLLYEEATMNIEELLAKYGRVVNDTQEAMKSLKNKEDDSASKVRERKPACKKQSSNEDVESQDDSAATEGAATGDAVDEKKVVEKDAQQETPESQKSTSDDSNPPVNEKKNDEADGKVTDALPNKKLKKTFVKAKAQKPDNDDDSDDDDYEGFESDEAMEGSSSEEEDLSDEEEEEDEESEEEEEESLEMDLKDGSRGMGMAGGLEEPGSDSGTTAVVAVLHDTRLFVANAGDSRCVLGRKKGVAFDMSDDHKPEDEAELKRIIAAGGHVNMQGRVNGGLNLSRALGDHSYKTNEDLPLEEQMISAMPDVRSVVLQPGDEFMVIACDGIWNVLSSQEVVDFVRDRLFPHNDLKEDECPENTGPMKLSQVCEELFQRCLSPNTLGDGTGCDNMTCVIVMFKQEWLQKRSLVNAENCSEEKAISKNNATGNPDIGKDSKQKGDTIDHEKELKSSDIQAEVTLDTTCLKESIKRPHTDNTDSVNCVNGNGVAAKRVKSE